MFSLIFLLILLRLIYSRRNGQAGKTDLLQKQTKINNRPFGGIKLK